MLTLVIGLVILPILACIIWWKPFTDEDPDLVPLMWVLMALIAMLPTLVTSFAIPAKYDVVISNTDKIVTARDNQSVKGSFMLGCGTIEGVMKYTYYVDNGDSYNLKSIDASMAEIKYLKDSTSVPRVETISHIRTDAIINYFTLQREDDYYIVYVPEGSIGNNFQFDAQ